MIVGIPKEIKEGELRVALTPEAVRDLAGAGHRVLVQKSAGAGCDIDDDLYVEAGASLVDEAGEVWKEADMIVKVKEPVPSEYRYLRRNMILFTFLHLAANPGLTAELLKNEVISIGYETVKLEDGSLPLLAPMSEIAGCISVQKGAYCLEAHRDGRGILLTGISGAPPAGVTVIGGGVVGTNACRIALGMGAHVTVLDVSTGRLQYLRDIFSGRVTTLLSSKGVIRECLRESDVVLGAVLRPGCCAPKLIDREMLGIMPKKSVIVDVAIDQGGIAESSRPTTHDSPTYVDSGVVHCCITNLPAAVPRSATIALAESTIPYVLKIASGGLDSALIESKPLLEGLNTRGGEITHRGVAEDWNS